MPQPPTLFRPIGRVGRVGRWQIHGLQRRQGRARGAAVRHQGKAKKGGDPLAEDLSVDAVFWVIPAEIATWILAKKNTYPYRFAKWSINLTFRKSLFWLAPLTESWKKKGICRLGMSRGQLWFGWNGKLHDRLLGCEVMEDMFPRCGLTFCEY